MKEILNTIKERLKSPVVVVQLISIVGTIVIVFWPNLETDIKSLVVAVTSVYNIFAGINNPSDKEKF